MCEKVQKKKKGEKNFYEWLELHAICNSITMQIIDVPLPTLVCPGTTNWKNHGCTEKK